MFYIIYGQDNYTVHQELGKIKQGLGDPVLLSTNTNILDGRLITFNELTSLCSTAPFLSLFRLVIVEGLIGKFDTNSLPYSVNKNTTKVNSALKEWEPLSEYIENIPQSTTLVFLDTIEVKSAGKNPLFKHLAPKAKVIICTQLERAKLEEWVTRKISENGGSITTSATKLLIGHLGGDLWSLHNSIDMLLNYTSRKTITDKEVMQLASLDREIKIFDLTDAIINKQSAKAQRYLHKLTLGGATSFYILTMIGRQLRLIARVKDFGGTLSSSQVMSKVGITNDFVMEKTLKQAKLYSSDNIKEAYRKILDTDVAIKTGKYDGDLAMELLVVELCRT